MLCIEVQIAKVDEFKQGEARTLLDAWRTGNTDGSTVGIGTVDPAAPATPVTDPNTVNPEDVLDMS